jgi:hypothetical protein
LLTSNPRELLEVSLLVTKEIPITA